MGQQGVTLIQMLFALGLLATILLSTCFACVLAIVACGNRLAPDQAFCTRCGQRV